MNVSSAEVFAVDFKVRRMAGKINAGLFSLRNIIIISAPGTGESWLFSLDSQSGDFQVYKWTTANQLFIKVRKDISVLRKLSLIPFFPTTRT